MMCVNDHLARAAPSGDDADVRRADAMTSPRIADARKPSERGDVLTSPSSDYVGGSDGRRAEDDWWLEWQNYWFAEGILNAILEHYGMWQSDYDRIRGQLDVWRKDLERRRNRMGDAP